MKRNVGAVVLACGCLAAGVAIGRMSAEVPSATSLQTEGIVAAAPAIPNDTASARASAPEQHSQERAAAEQPPKADQTPGNANQPPSLALKSDPESAESGEEKVQAAAPPKKPKLLNPGTARSVAGAGAEVAKVEEPASQDLAADPPKRQQPQPAERAKSAEPAKSDPPKAARLEPPRSTASEPPQADDAARKRRRWKRELAKPRAARSREQTARRSPPASSTRDYQSLRDYVLTR